VEICKDEYLRQAHARSAWQSVERSELQYPFVFAYAR